MTKGVTEVAIRQFPLISDIYVGYSTLNDGNKNEDGNCLEGKISISAFI